VETRVVRAFVHIAIDYGPGIARTIRRAFLDALLIGKLQATLRAVLKIRRTRAFAERTEIFRTSHYGWLFRNRYFTQQYRFPSVPGDFVHPRSQILSANACLMYFRAVVLLQRRLAAICAVVYHPSDSGSSSMPS